MTIPLPQDSLLAKGKANDVDQVDGDDDGRDAEVSMDELKRQEDEMLRVLNLYKVSVMERERATYLMTSVTWVNRNHYYNEDAIGCYKYFGTPIIIIIIIIIIIMIRQTRRRHSLGTSG